MKRRDSIKTILLSAIGTSITLESCITPECENIANKVWEYQYGVTAYEKSRDEKFLNSVFFNNNELSTIEKIANIIVPPNEFGNIKDAGVVEMIEFIAKDWSTPAHNNYGENVLRKGLNFVLDELFQKEFGKTILECSEDEIKRVFDKISYQDNISDELSEAAKLFCNI